MMTRGTMDRIIPQQDKCMMKKMHCKEMQKLGYNERCSELKAKYENKIKPHYRPTVTIKREFTSMFDTRQERNNLTK